MITMKPLRFAVILAIVFCMNEKVSSDEIVPLADIELSGPNVCKKREFYTVEVVTTELQTYQERTTSWCVNWPPKCSTYRLKHKTVNKTSNIEKERIVRSCCDGYKRDLQSNGCVPECKLGCIHGKCVEPEKCKCDHGYGGPTCNISALISFLVFFLQFVVLVHLVYISIDTPTIDYGQAIINQYKLL